jgi:hypothetical protein
MLLVGFLALLAPEDTVDKIQQDLMRALSAGEMKGDRWEEFIRRGFDFAAEHRGTPVGMNALMFVTQLGRYTPEPPAAVDKAWTEAMDLLIENYMNSDQAELLVMSLGQQGGRFAMAFEYLDWIADEAQSDAVRGGALLGQVRQYSMLAEEGELDDEQHAKAMAICDRIESEFAEVETIMGMLGAMVEPLRFEMTHLVVGKPVPDIEGEDLDGVTFKLSDYRGKVVMLDFWGDW